MRTFNREYGYKLVKAVHEDEPNGIRPRRLRLKTQLYSKTFDSWIKRLIVDFGIFVKDRHGYVHLTEGSKTEYENGRLKIPFDRNSKSNKTHIRTKAQTENKENERRDHAYVILALLGALGDCRYIRTSKPQYGSPSMFDIATREEIPFEPSAIPGVGISDFIWKEREGTQSTLDRRILVGHGELFSYHKFTGKEIEQCINELTSLDKPVLKELTRADYSDKLSEIIRKEKRYIIADSLLRDFIILCNQMLYLTLEEMQYAASIQKVGETGIGMRNKSQLSFSESYRNLLEKRYGRHYRRTTESIVASWKSRNKYYKLNKKYRLNILNFWNEMLTSSGKLIGETYTELMSEKYEQIREGYSIVTTPLLEICYPDSVKELHQH